MHANNFYYVFSVHDPRLDMKKNMPRMRKMIAHVCCKETTLTTIWSLTISQHLELKKQSHQSYQKK